MMTAEALFNAITEIKDELVDQAARTRPARKKVHWLKFGAVAAAFAVAVGLGAGVLSGKLPWLPVGSQPNSFEPGGSAGGSGHDEGSVFMSYAGPVFPLTALEGGEELTASRDLTYDFSPWTPVWISVEDMADESIANGGVWTREEYLKLYRKTWPEGGYQVYSTDLLITDAYTLTNHSGEDQTVTLLYPFVSGLYGLPDHRPALTVDGAEVETALHVGGYSGGFQGALGSEEKGSVNLDGFHSWEDYRNLLASGGYQAGALAGFPDLSGVPVTVYEFTNAWAPEELPANILVQMELDYSKTTILTHGFSGGSYDPEAGRMRRNFWVPDLHLEDDGPFLLFVLGEPVTSFEVKATPNGDPTSTDYLEFGVEAGVDMRTYETDLESALRMAAEGMYDMRSWEDPNGEVKRPDFELFFGLLKEDLAAYGVLSDGPVERYDHGSLEAMDTASMDRVFYLEATITVPAGASVAVEASFHKESSYDFYCAHTGNQNVYGYDMVTRLGTTLHFTSQTARAVNTELVEIVRENYGFDWASGVDKVTLDADVEHYYLEVRRAEEP